MYPWTSESYNKTGLGGKKGVNLTSVHGFIWCLYTAFLSLTPRSPAPSHTQSSSLFKSDSESNKLCCETPCPLAPSLTKMPVLTQDYVQGSCSTHMTPAKHPHPIRSKFFSWVCTGLWASWVSLFLPEHRINISITFVVNVRQFVDK